MIKLFDPSILGKYNKFCDYCSKLLDIYPPVKRRKWDDPVFFDGGFNLCSNRCKKLYKRELMLNKFGENK